MSSQEGGLQSVSIRWLSWGGTGGLISILLLPFHRREKESCLRRVRRRSSPKWFVKSGRNSDRGALAMAVPTELFVDILECAG